MKSGVLIIHPQTTILMNDYTFFKTRYRNRDGQWIESTATNLEEAMLAYRKLLRGRIKNRPQRYSFQYKFPHQLNWL